MTTETKNVIIHTLQESLEAIASPKKKAWWERYMRDVIRFRGVGIPDVRELQKGWYMHHLEPLSYEEQIEIVLELFRQELAEDKLAGIVLLQEYLYDKMPLEYMLGCYATLFDEELIYDWNVCDWFCVRVLTATIKKHDREAARMLSTWKDAPYLWQARASVVAFIGLTDTPEYYSYILDNCKTLIRREERFAKTAVGWILHDVYKRDEQVVMGFIDENLVSFSSESLKNALKHSPVEERKKYIAKLKKLSR